MEEPLFFDILEFPQNTAEDKPMGRSLFAKNELDQFSCFDTIPACDERTDTEAIATDDTALSYSVARVKSLLITCTVTFILQLNFNKLCFTL